ncbi:polysaccharide deacetylase family protein [Fulvivirga sediminis]|uniref:Polysaccharide deacetylase family protein n=1 Tax=Fulvivirga sediminis TaxID=2803949 RepID=A0A937K1V2_9BACT|nr:polysaccharide deacetylase family protein [Fulvivirga sediminis]MBL3657730.1 polysaccharide deacetylase family protein [Fulvivirga sediminis]
MQHNKILYTFLMLLGLFSSVSAQKKMAVTIDDLTNMSVGKDPELIRYVNTEIVKTCVKYQVPAIGFVNETHLYKNNQLDSTEVEFLKIWVDNKLELGNHTYSHVDYNKVTEEQFFEEIEKGQLITSQLIKPAKVKYFRHPFLHRGNTAEKVKALEDYLKDHNMVEAPVTLDNSEWIYAAAYKKAFDADDDVMKDSIANSYVSYMISKIRYYENSSHTLFDRNISQILLVHDNLLNAEHLNELLEAIQKEGYQFVSLEEALKDPAYNSEDDVVAGWGISWLQRWAITQKQPKKFYEGEPLCPDFIQEYSGISE